MVYVQEVQAAFSEELATKPEVEALIDKWDSASN